MSLRQKIPRLVGMYDFPAVGVHGEPKMSDTLKAPFPYFGGKRKAAHLVWQRLGQPDNFVEPFAGGLAVLLARPGGASGVETVNDVDHHLVNFWRATSRDPDAVAAHADWPVAEADLHSRHRWLVLGPDADGFRERMRQDPDHFDARRAGWWVWGICCWIGGGWCSGVGAGESRRPKIAQSHSAHIQGVHGQAKLRIAAHNKGSVGKGVHAAGGLAEKVPRLGNDLALLAGPGRDGGALQRPAGESPLTGVHTGDPGTCAERRAWLLDWFARLADRLRNVRVCCGDWLRVCGSPSVTTRLGSTGVFLDPPYPRRQGRKKSREGGLYASDGHAKSPERLRDEVLAWCRERGGHPLMRVCVAGYEGDGYEALEAEHGWRSVWWKSSGGYSNRKNKKNRFRERLWFSPHCRHEAGLFDQMGDGPTTDQIVDSTPIP